MTSQESEVVCFDGFIVLFDCFYSVFELFPKDETFHDSDQNCGQRIHLFLAENTRTTLIAAAASARSCFIRLCLLSDCFSENVIKVNSGLLLKCLQKICILLISSMQKRCLNKRKQPVRDSSQTGCFPHGLRCCASLPAYHS